MLNIHRQTDAELFDQLVCIKVQAYNLLAPKGATEIHLVESLECYFKHVTR